MWLQAEIIQYLSNQLASEDKDLAAQSSYFGIDSFPETQLHPLLHKAFADSHLGAHREVCYPSSTESLPHNSQRQRCDLVLTADPSLKIFDPIDEQKVQHRAVGTLFEAIAAQAPTPRDVVLPEDAYWLEVKSIAQFSYVDGVPSPNASYNTEMIQGPKMDVIKLASEPMIRHAGVLIVHFAQRVEVSRNDIGMAVDRLISQDLPVSVPIFESFPITNHAGNEFCTLGIIPVRL